MDILQVSIIFLIILLTIFLSVIFFQAFTILRDLKKTLDKVGQNLKIDEGVKSEISKSKVKLRAVSLPRRLFKKVR